MARPLISAPPQRTLTESERIVARARRMALGVERPDPPPDLSARPETQRERPEAERAQARRVEQIRHQAEAAAARAAFAGGTPPPSPVQRELTEAERASYEIRLKKARAEELRREQHTGPRPIDDRRHRPVPPGFAAHEDPAFAAARAAMLGVSPGRPGAAIGPARRNFRPAVVVPAITPVVAQEPPASPAVPVVPAEPAGPAPSPAAAPLTPDQARAGADRPGGRAEPAQPSQDALANPGRRASRPRRKKQ